MRVLHFSGFVDPAGRRPEELMQVWTSLVDVAVAAHHAGAQVEVLQAARHDQEIFHEGVRFSFVKEPRYPRLRGALGHRAAPHPWRTLHQLARRDSDLVHMHGLSFPFQARVLTAGPVPVLAQDHADRPAAGWRRPIQAWGYRRLTAVAFTARGQAEEFFAAGVLPRRLPVVEVPEASTRLAPVARAEARRRTGMSGNPAVLWVGHLAQGKDPLTALRAAELAWRSRPDLRLWIAFQSDRLLPDIRKWMETSDFPSDRVHLLGSVPHPRMAEYVSAADVALSTSRREGSGFVILEALACGTPIVVSDIPAARAIVGVQSGARIAPVGDARGFADGLLDLTAVDADPSVLRQSVRRHFEERLAYPAIGRRLVEGYRRTIETLGKVA